MECILEDKILITGTGRTGTTVLVKLLSLLGLETGYHTLDETEIEKYIYQQSNGGLEGWYPLIDEVGKTPLICKSPDFYNRIPELSQKYNIKKVFVPMRDLKLTAYSRARHGGGVPGGLWNAVDVQEQMIHNTNVVYQIVMDCTQYDISLSFIDFDRLTSNKEYAYDVYKSFCEVSLDDIQDFTSFASIYDKVINPDKINTKYIDV